MSLSLLAGSKSYEIGTASFLKSFFSTVYVRLESGKWGSRFPTLMNKLYMGQVAAFDCDDALAELQTVKTELAKLPPGDVVWDFEDLTKRPPWGPNISPSIDSLATYFWTSDGQELLTVVAEALVHGRRAGTGVSIA
jgi:hypothetical protein